jgi:hypothetical protein
MSVEDWPSHDFSSRKQFFENNREQLDLKNAENIPPGLSSHMGTSYWPDGYLLQKNLNREDWEIFATSHNFKKYLELVSNPKILGRLVVATYRVFLSSDYRLNYLRSDGTTALKRDYILKNFGWVFLATCIAFAAFYRGPYLLHTVALGMAALPIAVVIGDGFYEFEKHMVAYFILLPALGVLLAAGNEAEATSTQIPIE